MSATTYGSGVDPTKTITQPGRCDKNSVKITEKGVTKCVKITKKSVTKCDKARKMM